VYTREAHLGEHLPAHASLADKLAAARRLRDELGITRMILVDDHDGSVHTAYGLLPNMSWVLARGGTILYKATWISAARIGEFLRRRAVQRHGPGASGPAAVADSATHMHTLETEGPNFRTAANGDMVTITGHADFSVNPKSAEGSGTFTHTSNGTVVGGGSWTATGLLDYQSYGCGIVFDIPLPPNFCGGKVKLRVTLTTPLGRLPATMTVICIIGPNPPDSAFGDKRSEARCSTFRA
jgi:hypothetical protein